MTHRFQISSFIGHWTKRLGKNKKNRTFSLDAINEQNRTKSESLKTCHLHFSIVSRMIFSHFDFRSNGRRTVMQTTFFLLYFCISSFNKLLFCTQNVFFFVDKNTHFSSNKDSANRKDKQTFYTFSHWLEKFDLGCFSRVRCNCVMAMKWTKYVFILAAATAAAYIFEPHVCVTAFNQTKTSCFQWMRSMSKVRA